MLRYCRMVWMCFFPAYLGVVLFSRPSLRPLGISRFDTTTAEGSHLPLYFGLAAAYGELE